MVSVFYARPYPDEICGSILIRACRHLGLGLKRLLPCAIGRQTRYSSFLLPTWLPQLASLTGVPAKTLLWEHTVFPYVVAFMAPEQVRRLESKALCPETGASLSSLTKSVTHGVLNRRLCPDCVDYDLLRYGETYWHRSHLLPGMHVCPVHGTALRETRIPLRGADSSLPQDMAGYRYKSSHTQLLANIAEQSQDAMNRRRHRDNWPARYREAALKRGYRLRSGNAASQQLSKDVRQFVGAGLLKEMGCAIAARKAIPWPHHLMQASNSVEHAPPKHVLMGVFLSSRRAAVVLRYRTAGAKPLDCDQLDQRCAQAVTRLLGYLRTTGKRITVRELLTRCGCWMHFRHHRAKYPLTKALLLEFRASDMSERQIGRRPCWRKRLGLE